MTAKQIIVDRLNNIANDDQLQIESIENLEFADTTANHKQENQLAIESLTKRSATIAKMAEIVDAKGIANLTDFRQLLIHKFYVRGRNADSGTFYSEVDRLIVTLETLIQLGVNEVR